MKKYKSHKIVEAGKMTAMDAKSEQVLVDGGDWVQLDRRAFSRIAQAAHESVSALSPGYLVRYEDGYLSWSPAEAFESGYTELRETGGIHPAPQAVTDEELALDPIMRNFHYEHLPESLREASQPFCELALFVIRNLPRGPERTVALRKLLEGKDAAVRTCI